LHQEHILGKKGLILSRWVFYIAGLLIAGTALAFAISPHRFQNEILKTAPIVNGKTILLQDFRTMERLDPKIWNNKGTLPWGTKRNQATGEIQDYTADAVHLARDGLCFTARRNPDGNWTSGSVDTQGKFLFEPDTVTTIQYKLPQSVSQMSGFTPAIWMGYEPLNGQWRWPPEVDVIEALGKDGFKTAHTTLHYDTDDKTIFNTESYKNKLDGVYTHPGPDVSQGWNTAVVDRRNHQLIISHNEVVTLKISNPDIVPEEPMFMILSFPIGVGGEGWAGLANAETPSTGEFCISSLKVEKK
jgi:beta-glucanase (GH16 family)